MRPYYCISIGVRQSGKLPELPGAIPDAKRFAAWARSCPDKYRTAVITDERKPVTIERLKGRVAQILKEFPQRLIIYYSGHGIYSRLADQWLLSSYDQDGTEAVNLYPSIRNARRLGVGQVAVFSDACRSSIAAAGLVDGTTIFPSPQLGGTQNAPYDEFFSTDISQPAQEVEGNADSYGIFTKCLLNALSGRERGAGEERGNKLVVSSAALANHLEKQVPFETGLIPNALVQMPSITASWRRPDDTYAEVIEKRNGGRRIAVLGEGTSKSENVLRLETAARHQATIAKAERKRLINERSRTFAEANSAQVPLGSSQGYRLVGQRVRSVTVNNEPRPFRNGGYIEVNEPGAELTIELADFGLIRLPIYRGFVGTVVIGDQGVENISFTPGDSAYRWSHPDVQPVISDWNALLSVARTPSQSKLRDFADKMRQFKHDNPALGILAAYAYERAGVVEELASVAWYLADRNGFVPFDIYMLLEFYGDSRELIDQVGHATQYEVVGTFPMLSRGWFMISEINDYPRLARLRGSLRNSVWTTFDRDAARELLWQKLGSFI